MANSTSVVHQVKPPRGNKSKGGTTTTRKHRFQSFSQRIQNLKIEPVRRARRHDFDGAQTSYFHDAFNKWKDTNLSDNFSSFASELAPLCDSLPQILHYSDTIVDILVKYLEKHDDFSLEPLLDLVAQFAHDLGERFEKYFERVLSVVVDVAARHENIEAIEWSFNCLAWLFKYLSRLLVPDLRHLFDWLAPLLGKKQQKHFVPTFAAEALSFLVRKAAQKYHKDQKPLQLIVSHILRDAEDFSSDSAAAPRYYYAIMTLFAESMKGVQNGLSSGAENILKELISQTIAIAENCDIPDFDSTRPSEGILYGVVTHLLHFTLRETFAPLLQTILQELSLDVRSTPAHLVTLARILLVVMGVRKASRVQDWQPVMSTVSALTDLAQKTAGALSRKILSDCLACLAVAMHSCPMDVLLPHLRAVDTLRSGSLAAYFLPFCNLFSTLNPQRFKDFVLSHFQKFIVQQWQTYGESLAILLPIMADNGRLDCFSLTCPPQWESSMQQLFDLKTKGSNKELHESNAWLLLAEILKVSDGHKSTLADRIKPVLSTVLRSDEALPADPQFRLTSGKAFEFITKEAQSSLQLVAWAEITHAAPKYASLVPFWRAVSEFLKRNRSDLDFTTPHQEFLDSLCLCLASPAHELRLLALEVIQHIVPDGPLSDAIAIETSPLDLANARNISYRIHTLGSTYKDHVTNPWLMRAVPSYCMGLMHLRLSQAWDDAVKAIQEICVLKEGDAAISEIAFSWLEDAPLLELSDTNITQLDSEPPKASNHFECFNHLNIQWTMSRTQETFNDVESELHKLFVYHNRLLQLHNRDCRSQALKVLNGIPQIAEKRNRSLVPILLRWAGNDDGQAVEDSPTRWNRKDQKALLSLFAQFVNPRVLYASDNVYAALLQLLKNADIEMQKSALKAILTWKQPEVQKYEEDLFKLLDDKSFRDQLSVFLGYDDDRSVRPEHRELVTPVILRILYGKLTLREGSASGKQGQHSRRKAVFTALSRSDSSSATAAEFHQFLTIALGQLSDIKVVGDDGVDESSLQKVERVMEPRKQFGMLNLLTDLLETLRSDVQPFALRLIEPILSCLFLACRQSPTQTNDVDMSEIEAEADTSKSTQGLHKALRQAGYRCLNLLFTYSAGIDWAPYVQAILKELVEPRLAHFPSENSQSISGLTRLFSVWASSPHLAVFLDFGSKDATILGQVSKCLTENSTKPDVKAFVIDDVWRKLIGSANDAAKSSQVALQTQIQEHVIQPHVNIILLELSRILRQSPSKDLLDSAVSCVADIAPFVVAASESWNMVQVCTFLLREPARRVSPRTKHNLLRILKELVSQCDGEDFANLLEVVSSLFEYFRDRANRILLSEVMSCIAGTDAKWIEVASLCADLNSFDTIRLDEPDFDRRARAFQIMSEEASATTFNLEHWKPVIYNYLYYLNDLENFSIRLDASAGLRRFVGICSAATSEHQMDMLRFIEAAVLPSIRKGIKDAPELVRAEHLSVLAQIIRSFPNWPETADMHALLAGNDDEASFFANILHVQQHRRLKALRRLASEAGTSNITHTNISRLLIPLLEHFIFDQAAADETAHNLANEAINTIGVLVRWLQWQQYKALLKRYIDFLGSKEGMEKTIVKLIGSSVDGLRHSCHRAGFTMSDRARHSDPTSREIQINGSNGPSEMEIDETQSRLAATMPDHDAVCRELISNSIPTLTKYVHNKDDTEENLRIPVAVSLIKLLKILPQDEFAARLPSVLLDICQILRSRSQDVRDLTRKTLAEMATLLGPACFGFLLKELRTALPRGYQLHVLSYTVHSILLVLVEVTEPGQLDYCLPQLMEVVMDDIFGVTGQEKDAEDYISRMKEVKSQKSFDSAEVVSRIASTSHLIDIIRPIEALLREKLDLKLVRKIDELLRRIELGITQNAASNNRRLLQVSYEIIRQASSSNLRDTAVNGRPDHKLKRYLINMKSAAKSGNKGATSAYTYKMSCFGMSLLRSVLKRHDELQTPENIAEFIPLVGDALLSGHEEVQLTAVKLLTRIIKTPMLALDENGPVYISTAYSIVKNSPNTNTELAQAALKLISAVLRDRPALALREVKKTQLAYLLTHLKPDLREPDKQGVAFNFIRAILSRKIVIPEAYEIMDSDIITIMITNQTQAIRDHARGVYVQFILAYPQTKDRFRKQFGRVLKNLTYEHAEGRRSVLECLNDLLGKVDAELMSEVSISCFLALSLTMTNDDAKDCKEMAKSLVGKLFQKATADAEKEMLSLMKKYVEQSSQMTLRGLGIQLFALSAQSKQGEFKDLQFFIHTIEATLNECIEMGGNDEWELAFRSLRAISTSLYQVAPAAIISSDTTRIWESVISCLAYPHTWVKEAAAQAVQCCFTDLARTNKDNGFAALPLVSSNGFEMHSQQMVQAAHSSLRILRAPELREEFAMLTVKNLSFLARVFAANNLQWPARSAQIAGRDQDPFQAEIAQKYELDDDDDISEDDTTSKANGHTNAPPISATTYLLSALAAILRRPLAPGTPSHPPSLAAKTSTLTLLASLINSLQLATLESVLPALLRPLLILISPTTTHPSFPYQSAWTESYKSYLSNAQETIDLIRQKLGDTAFAALTREVESSIRVEREQRGIKRRMERVREPEKEEMRKKRRREKVLGKKRERNLVAKGRGNW